MLRKDFVELQLKVARDAQELCIGKGEDYAGEDKLSNFKRMSLLCQILDIQPQRSPGDSARFLMLLKVDRWCNLVKKGTPPYFGSVRDTILDLHNYVDLAYACELEEKK